MKITDKLNVVIVNGALRLTDNPLLEGLNQSSVVFVFALTPYYFGKGHYTEIPNVGENRIKYLFACIEKFKVLIKDNYNADLLVLEGTYKQVVDQIVSSYNSFKSLEVRVMHQPYKYEKTYEKELLDDPYYNLLSNKVNIINNGMTLFPVDVLTSIYKQTKGHSFKSFHFACLREQAKIKWVDTSNITIVPITVNLQSIDGDKDSFNFFYDLKEIENYEKNKKLISGTSTTKLEGALSLGTVSKVMAYGLALNCKADDNNKKEFIRSLIWNDYCWIISKMEGNKIFSKNGLSKNLNRGKLEVIPDFIKGTGIEVKFYNKAMSRLRTEGYLPNRLRIILGSYIVKVLGYSHLALAEYFEHYLLGFNVHNNWIGAQSCNGTGVDTVVRGRCFNIRTQLEKYDLNNEYL